MKRASLKKIEKHLDAVKLRAEQQILDKDPRIAGLQTQMLKIDERVKKEGLR